MAHAGVHGGRGSRLSPSPPARALARRADRGHHAARSSHLLEAPTGRSRRVSPLPRPDTACAARGALRARRRVFPGPARGSHRLYQLGSRQSHFFRFLRCRYEVGTSEAYLYDAFTDPAYRGRGIAPALGVHVLWEFRRAGLTRAMMAVAPENVANRRARAKTGFRAFGRIDHLRLGRWSRHWHRTVERRSRH